MLSVSLFYAFNSITTQSALSELSATKKLLADQMGIFISVLSVMIAIVLGFLIIYANQFLLKRRTKELGIYMTLGMGKGKISRIFVGETIVIGIVALTVGLSLGFILSQGLSLISLKLFAVDLSSYSILFSVEALKKTIICFVIIFVLVMICNVWIVSRVKLIDLLTASRKNETLIILNKGFGLIIFAGAIVCMTVALSMFSKYGIMPNTKIFKPAIILLMAGTGMFFYSLAAVFLIMLQSNKRIYLKDLNVFLMRQIGSKIQTNFLSMSVICGLLAVTICTVSTGISIAITMNQNAEESTPYDLAVITSVNRAGDVDILEDLNSKGYDLTPYIEKSLQFSLFVSNYTYGDLFEDQDVQLWEIDNDLLDVEMHIISLTDFNRTMTFQGKEPLSLESGSFYLNCNYKGTKKYVEEFLKQDGTVTINDEILHAAQSQPLSETIWMTTIGNNDRGTLVVPDEIAANLRKGSSLLAVNYKENVNTDEVVYLLLPVALEPLITGYRYIAKSMAYDAYYGSQALLSFICCYVGLIFLLICVAVLAIQQLTETADNKYRYGLLQKIGSDQAQVNKTLFRQIFIYFFSPLALAGIYSIFGIREVLKIVEIFLNMNVTTNIIFTIILFLLIYGGYFLACYITCRRIIEEKIE